MKKKDSTVLIYKIKSDINQGLINSFVKLLLITTFARMHNIQVKYFWKPVFTYSTNPVKSVDKLQIKLMR